MDKLLELNIVQLIGVLVVFVTAISIVFSIVLVLLFKRKNEIKKNYLSEIEIKDSFEIITPVIIKKVQKITKIIEEKPKYYSDEKIITPKIAVSEDDVKSEKIDSKLTEKSEEDASVKAKPEERDVSERYKIEERFLKKK